jgi:hypothetical protein
MTFDTFTGPTLPPFFEKTYPVPIPRKATKKRTNNRAGVMNDVV